MNDNADTDRRESTGANEVTEHPVPSTATVKELYAHAFRCAHPDCGRPLYKLDDDTGARTLNSRVAHIHARSKGGPRWITMSSADNRDASNLLLLCIEHSYEIDEHPSRFPADTLRGWKTAQLDEHRQILERWPLTDDQAAEVQRESFDAQAQAHVDAVTLAELARATEAAATTARRSRELPRREVDRARRVWDQAQLGFYAIDRETGEVIHGKPSPFEQDQLQQARDLALTRAATDLTPVIDRLREQVAALRAARPDTGPWCEWVLTRAGELGRVSATWPDPLPTPDDDRVEHASAELGHAARALDDRVRGRDAAHPPAPDPSPEPDPPRRDDQLAAHRELLARARPFDRIDTLPYDPDLREQVAAASTFAATLAPTLSQWPIGLQATASLAAAIAGNASEEQLLSLAETDQLRRPTCTAVMLLCELALRATDRGHDDIAHDSWRRVADLFEHTDWTDPSAWEGNEIYGAVMLSRMAHACSPERVRHVLTETVRAAPQLAATILLGCAEWTERLYRTRPTDPSTGIRDYRTCPDWLPASEIITAYEATSRSATPGAASQPDNTELARLARELRECLPRRDGQK